MNYIIHTPSAARLKKEILYRVSVKAAVEREQSKDVLLDCRAEAGSALANVDADGKGIATWQCVEIAAGERVLVHTATSFKSSSIIGTLEKIDAMMMTSICLVDLRNFSWYIFPIMLIK